MLSCRVLESGLLSVLEGELEGGVQGLLWPRDTGWTLAPLISQLCANPTCPSVHSDPG